MFVEITRSLIGYPPEERVRQLTNTLVEWLNPSPFNTAPISSTAYQEVVEFLKAQINIALDEMAPPTVEFHQN